jgi:phosphatidate phosphatase APP1
MSEATHYVATASVLYLAAIVSVFGSELKQDEVLVFFPTLGYRVDAGKVWELEIHGQVYEPEERKAALALFRAALALKTELSASENEIFTERARAFLVDHERGKQITIRLGETLHRVGKSAPNGQVIGHVRVPADTVEKWHRSAGTSAPITFSAVTSPKVQQTWTGTVHLLEETGLSVISDIDDTLKITQVNDHAKLLANTFLMPFQPVAGMAAVYQKWQTEGATFHYASASPWQLYGPLADFMRANGFPAGTFHLKNFRWADESFLKLFQSPEQYKFSVIEPLLMRFPQRRFILVGDSGEQDPEIYGVLARRYPHQIERIFIRDVTEEPTAAARYRIAFKDLPVNRWKVFRKPQELERR